MEQIQKTAEMSEIKVDTKSPPEADQPLAGKILFIILGILIAGSIAVTYWRYMIKRDYVIQAQIDCDPETENCLVWRCDLMSLEEGEKCTGNPDNDIWYYKILNRNAKNIPDCDPAEEDCTAYQCEPAEQECEITSCEPVVASEEECSIPEKYLLENPMEEESQCEEGDEECALDQECALDDEECPAAKEECLPGDKDCLEAQNPACDPESDDCDAAISEECALGDENCTPAPADEIIPVSLEKASTEPSDIRNDQDSNVPPPGVEPM